VELDSLRGKVNVVVLAFGMISYTTGAYAWNVSRFSFNSQKPASKDWLSDLLFHSCWSLRSDLISIKSFLITILSLLKLHYGGAFLAITMAVLVLL